MREIRTSGSMSGSEKPGQGWASEALPKETGSEPIGPTYRTRRSDSTLLIKKQLTIKSTYISGGGLSLFQMARAFFQEPSACRCQIQTYLPLA